MQRLYGTEEHKPFAGGKDIIGRDLPLHKSTRGTT